MKMFKRRYVLDFGEMFRRQFSLEKNLSIDAFPLPKVFNKNINFYSILKYFMVFAYFFFRMKR